MKLRASALAAAMIAGAVMASAQISWTDTIAHFGTIDEDLGKASRELTFVNRGTDDVAITDVRPTCGCTAGRYSKRAIAPGDTGRVTVIYDPEGRPGPFEKQVIVYVTSEPKRHVLTMEGVVIGAEHTVRAKYPDAIGDFRLANRILAYEEIHKGRSPMQTLRGYNASHDSLEIAFTDVPKHLKPMCVPDTAAPGATIAITVFYESGKNSEWGITTDTIGVKVRNLASGQVTTGTIEAIALLSEDVAFFPASMLAKPPRISDIPAVVTLPEVTGNHSVVSNIGRFFTVKNVGKGRLEVRRIVSYDPALTASPDRLTLEPGQSAEVEISLNLDALKPSPSRFFTGRLLLLCNDVGRPNIPIEVRAEIMPRYRHPEPDIPTPRPVQPPLLDK